MHIALSAEKIKGSYEASANQNVRELILKGEEGKATSTGTLTYELGVDSCQCSQNIYSPTVASHYAYMMKNEEEKKN